MKAHYRTCNDLDRIAKQGGFLGWCADKLRRRITTIIADDSYDGARLKRNINN